MVNKFQVFSLVLMSMFMLSFVFAETGDTNVYFTTGNAVYSCVRDTPMEAYWQKVDNGDKTWIYNATFNGPNVCNNTIYSSAWCCPKDFQCNAGICVANNLTYSGDYCNTLSNAATCNTSSASFALSLIAKFNESYSDACSPSNSLFGYLENGHICSNMTTCSCIWKSNALGSGKGACSLTISEEKTCEGGGTAGLRNCSWVEDPSLTEDKCADEGKIFIIYPATGVDVNGVPCVDQKVPYPCSVSVQLPFFDKFSFIFAALAIVGIYFILNRR